MTKTFTASETKSSFYDLLSKVSNGNVEIIVTRNGKPAAVLMSVGELSQLKETIDVLSDPDMMHQVAVSNPYYKKHRHGKSFEDVFGEPLLPAKKE